MFVLFFQIRTTPLLCSVCVVLWPPFLAASPWPASSRASVWSTSVLSPALLYLPARGRHILGVATQQPTPALPACLSAWWCCIDHDEQHGNHQHCRHPYPSQLLRRLSFTNNRGERIYPHFLISIWIHLKWWYNKKHKVLKYKLYA